MILLRLFSIFCLLFGFLSAQASLSSTLLDKELRSMLSAKTLSDLDAAIKDHDKIRTSRAECEVQLDRQRLPTICFVVLTQEVRAGFIAAKQAKEQEAWLDQLCVRRLKLVRDREEIRKLLTIASLPRACRSAAEDRNADLRYTQEAENPSRLFKERQNGEIARPLHMLPSS